MTLVSPLWLLGLLLVPLIRELHRWRGGGPRVRVQFLPLWQDAQEPEAAGSRRTPPDPAWRRRAGAIGLLLLALSDPRWQPRGLDSVDILVPLGPSLLTREPDGRRRYEQAARPLALALARTGAAQVRLVPDLIDKPAVILSRIDESTLAQALMTLAQSGSSPSRPRPTPAEASPVARVQTWLVSDGTPGASPRDERPFTQVFPIGSERENQGILSLAARPALEDPKRIAVRVEILNAGELGARRRLILGLGARESATEDLSLAPGQSLVRDFQLAGPLHGQLSARLEPADALESDDRLTLDLSPLAPIGVSLDADCPPQVKALVAAHPLVALDPGAQALRVHCGDAPPGEAAIPTLWINTGRPLPPGQGTPLWLDGSLGQSAALAAGSLVPLAPAQPPEGEVLLALDQVPLVLGSTQGQGFITLFDTQAGDPQAQALVLSTLLRRLAGRDLLWPRASAARPAEGLRVAPGPLPEPNTDAVAVAQVQRPLWMALLLAALGLLVLDLWRTHRGSQ